MKDSSEEIVGGFWLGQLATTPREKSFWAWNQLRMSSRCVHGFDAGPHHLSAPLVEETNGLRIPCGDAPQSREIIRDLNYTPPVRKKNIEQILSDVIDEDGGPPIHGGRSGEQQWSFDSTCRKFHRFLRQPRR